jgi:hypothetical protein
MKHTLRFILVLIGWFAASTYMAHLWVTNPASFPSLPAWFWNWADSHYQSRNAEEIANLEFFVTLAISAGFVLLICLVGYSIWRTTRSRAQSESQL